MRPLLPAAHPEDPTLPGSFSHFFLELHMCAQMLLVSGWVQARRCGAIRCLSGDPCLPAPRRSHTCSRPGPRLLWAGHPVNAHKNPIPVIQTVRFREGVWPTQGRTADLARARAHKQNDWTRLLAKQHQLRLAGGWGHRAPALPRNSAQHSPGGGRLILPTLPSSGWVWALGHVSWAAPQGCRDKAKAGPQGGCVWEGASRGINTVH